MAPKVEEHNGRLASLERGEVEASDSLTRVIDVMDARFESLREQYGSMSDRYGDMQHDIDGLRDDLREIRAGIGRHRLD